MKIGRTPISPVYNDIINSSTGPWKQMLNEVFFGNDVDGSLRQAQKTMQRSSTTRTDRGTASGAPAHGPGARHRRQPGPSARLDPSAWHASI